MPGLGNTIWKHIMKIIRYYLISELKLKYGSDVVQMSLKICGSMVWNSPETRETHTYNQLSFQQSAEKKLIIFYNKKWQTTYTKRGIFICTMNHTLKLPGCVINLNMESLTPQLLE